MRVLTTILCFIFMSAIAIAQDSSTSEKIKVIIKSEPSGATVLIDGVRQKSMTPLEVTIEGRRIHMIELRQSGYETFWKQIDARNHDVTKPIYEDKLIMTPKTVPLLIESTPPGALVSLDQEDLGKTPVYLKAVPYGMYDVVFRFTGHSDMRRRVDLTRGQIRIVKANLESIMSTVTLITGSESDVYLDGSLKGKTDGDGKIILKEVVEGRHLITIKKTGYEDLEQRFILKRNENKIISAPELMKKPGTVKVQSNPTGANVYRDGLLVGMTPVELNNLQPGTVVIKVEKDGFTEQTKETSVIAGITKAVNFKLQSTYGSLTVTTEPPACSIIISGADKGTTLPGAAPGISRPFTIKKLKPGLYNLIIEKAGYDSLTRKVLVQRGKNTRLAPFKLSEQWLPTHLLKLRGTIKLVKVRVLVENEKEIEIEERKGKSVIRYPVKRENIITLKEVE